MRSRLCSVLLLCLCLAPLAVHADAVVKIMPLGDSITRGGADAATPYPSYRYYLDSSLRSAGYGVDFVGSTSSGFTKFSFDQQHEGHGGYTTGMMVGTSTASPLASWLAASPTPEIVLLHIGTNDAITAVPLATRLANVKQIVTTLRQKNPKVRVMVAQIIPTANQYRNDNQIVPFNKALPSLAAGLSTPTSPVTVVDLYTGYDGVADNQADGIHPRTTGERKIAGAWQRALAPVLAAAVPTTVATTKPTTAPTTRPTTAAPTPKAYAVPGTLEAENYNAGGEGVAYHDTTPTNLGGAYRNDGVDIEPVAGGGYAVAYVRDGEWLKYTLSTATAGKYAATFRVAAWGTAAHAIEVRVNDQVAATVAVPSTGSCAAWTTATAALTLPAGTSTLKLRFVGDGQNLDRIVFAPAAVTTVPTTRPPTTIPTTVATTRPVTTVPTTPAAPGGTVRLPATVQAENYATGGEGVGYHDTTPGNQGGAYRSDGVDIEPIAGGYAVAYIRSGEWLEYSVEAPVERDYLLAFRLSSPSGGQFFEMKVDGRSEVTVIAPRTGSFGTYTTISTQVRLTKGVHRVRVQFYGDGQNFDCFSLS